MPITREARDTYFLIAVVAWICGQHLAHLPLWCSLSCAGVLLWRAGCIWRNKPLPARLWLGVWLAVGSGATLLTYQSLFGRNAGVTFIVLLLCLKTMELRNRRDAYTVFFLGFFTVLCNFLFSQTLLSAGGMLLGVVGLLALLVNTHMPAGRPTLTHVVRIASWMVLLGTPLMLALFLLFPRVAPLWGVPGESGQGRSGLSNDMQVGNIATLALDSSVAMRIQFEGPTPEPKEMYFRGPVLTHFDGRNWTSAGTNILPTPTQAIEVNSDPVHYQVILQPNQMPSLLVMEATVMPPELSGYRSVLRGDLQWRLNQPVNSIIRYRATSYPRYRYGLHPSANELQDALELPAGRNPRTMQWARELLQDPRYLKASTGAASQVDQPALVLAALTQLRTGGFRYTLTPGIYGDDTADEFWFDRKEGFCEHIASAFVVLMRALHIPARVVTGYQGGERNPLDGGWTVRQSDAHAWTEIWQDGQGWTRVDPTAVLAPQRTLSLVRLQAPQNIFSQAMEAVSPGLLGNGRSAWEAVNTRWNQWVLNYTQGTQMDLLRQAGYQAPDWHDLLQLLVATMAFISLITVAWIRWTQPRQDPWLKLLALTQKRLKKAGIPEQQPVTPRALAQQLQATRSQQNLAAQADIAALIEWLEALERWRYAASPTNPADGAQSAITLGTLRRKFHRLRWPSEISTDSRPP